MKSNSGADVVIGLSGKFTLELDNGDKIAGSFQELEFDIPAFNDSSLPLAVRRFLVIADDSVVELAKGGTVPFGQYDQDALVPRGWRARVSGGE